MNPYTTTQQSIIGYLYTVWVDTNLWRPCAQRPRILRTYHAKHKHKAQLQKLEHAHFQKRPSDRSKVFLGRPIVEKISWSTVVFSIGIIS